MNTYIIQMGDNVCSLCRSEWLFVAPKGLHHLCQECYSLMKQDVIEYHRLQDEAYEHIKQGKIDAAINVLKSVQYKRNEISKYFNNYLNQSHYRFANEFITDLIYRLDNCCDTIKPIDIWDTAFESLIPQL